MRLRNWGATPDEVSAQLPGDDICPDARIVATRSISLSASPEDVFPWLRQMGFGRAGWYSYDILDNLGRRSARRVHPEWQSLQAGDSVPGGPADFEAAIVEPPRAFVLTLGPGRARRQRIFFSLAYELRDDPSGTRLVTRVRARIDLPLGAPVASFVLGPGDGFMLRRQLVNVARRAETYSM